MVRRTTLFIIGRLMALTWAISSPESLPGVAHLEYFIPGVNDYGRPCFKCDLVSVIKLATPQTGNGLHIHVKRDANLTAISTSGTTSTASSTTLEDTNADIESTTKVPIFQVKDFESFKKKFKKIYKRRFREFRSKIAFEDNRNLVMEQEKNFKEGRSSFRCATNVMSDLSQIEYLMRYVRMTSNHYNSLLDGDHLVSSPAVNEKDIPEELDWRTSGFETPPDNQKSCGSCYAFSIARSIEGKFVKSQEVITFNPMSELI